MPKKPLNLDDVMDFLRDLPFNDFRKVVDDYSTHTKASFESEVEAVVITDFQKRLERLGINNSCPHCSGSSIVKAGIKPNKTQIFQCKDCKRRFTLFTGTILEKTKWHWDVWLKVLEMTLNHYSLHKMINVLESDLGCKGINHKTVWLWRMKLIHALAIQPMPTLTGIIQVDETFVRESQKGFHVKGTELISYIGSSVKRKARYGRQPSKYGVMGAEFATVTTAIDNRGYCVCKVSALGKLTKEIFLDQFEDHFDNPAYICSDANSVYDDYCELHDIPHYERPSNYLKIIENRGYKISPSTDIEKKKNEKILSDLYCEGIIDKITNRGNMTYTEFMNLKNANSLSLARVNELHSDLKKFIYSEMTNVSTKYLQDYIGFFTYVRNWRVTNGHYPTSKTDAESIFIEILRQKINYTTKDIRESKLTLPQPSPRYMRLLAEETEKARIATSNKYFKFDEEDGVKTFNRREYLLDQKKYKLHEICKECGLKRYKKLALYPLVSLILKQPNIEDIIYKLLAKDRHYSITDEDLKHIASKGFYK